MAANAYKTALNATNRFSNIFNKRQGGRMSKIGNYFQNIFNDYRTVAVETLSDIRTNPIRAAFYITSFGITGYLIKTNPSEESFYQDVTENASSLGTVGNAICNPYSLVHIENLMGCINQGVLKRTSFGICSFMWIDNFDPEVDLFEARCKHLKVGWLEWKERIIDFGILDKWWWMDKAMQDYDINPHEWSDSDHSSVAVK